MRNIIPKEQRDRTIANIIVVAAGIGMLAILYYFKSIWASIGVITNAVTPFILGGALAFLQLPVVRHLDRFFNKILPGKKPHPKLTRAVSCVISLLLLFAIVAVFLIILLPQLVSSIKQLLNLISRSLNQNIDMVNAFIQRYELNFLTVDGEKLNIAWEHLIGEYTVYIDTLLSLVSDLSSYIYHSALAVIVGLITSFYLLMGKEQLAAQAKRITYALLNRENSETLIRWTRKAGGIFTGFISGKILDSLIIGILCYISMLILRLEYPLLISVIVGITNIIPFFGPFIGAIPSVIILLMINPMHALIFAIFVLILQQLDGNIIGPLILKDYMGISPLWIMFSIVFGGNLFGFIGMLVSVPIFSLIYAIIQTIVEVRLRKKHLQTDLQYYESVPESMHKTDES